MGRLERVKNMGWVDAEARDSRTLAGPIISLNIVCIQDEKGET